MDVYEAISKRQTIRDFEDRQVPIKVLHKILNAGLQAPTNDHLRRWEFILVQDKVKRHEIVTQIHATKTTAGATKIVDKWGLVEPTQRQVYIEAIPKQQSMLLEAAVLILPCFFISGPILKPESLSSLNHLVSIWCCVENILVAAANEGIFGVTRIPFENERRFLKKYFHLPIGYEVPCYLALGYPKKGTPRIQQFEVRLEEKIHLNEW
jgi:nitroreductase